MSGKKIWASVATVVALGAVGGVAGTGYWVHDQLSDLEVKPGYVLPTAEQVLVPATPDPIDRNALTATLQALSDDPALGTFHARVSDGFTGEVLFDAHAAEPLTPASSTKVLTAASAIYTLGLDDTITTEVVRGTNPGEVVIKAAGDVWFSQETIDDLASQIGDASAVFVDTSIWSGDKIMPGWDPDNIDAGYIAPLEPVMIHGGRIGDTTGDVPRSHTPATDVAQALADQLGAGTVGTTTAPEGAEVIASVESPELAERLAEMMKESDNVMAEAIGREVALQRGADAPQATLDILAEEGFDLTGVTLSDNSGLSTDNLITPQLLDDILVRATTEDELRPLLATLPVAGGEGTLTTRYGDLGGKGWVRAKTGTLTGVNALVGTVTSDRGNVYTFAFLANDADINGARRAMDTLASALRDF
ncbi:D-alanyl-D-alanine carboxypeptidase/D-alanyl-D-alanine-endopeptidase [Corynebacterium breve]|uniref:D-alanyl-D-alanine carboxypeptidase/D-alanyl-D-alanine-endopeptidase n=1 Tax=Corynebacterium breve TaxID=3049799 RepID=A0ABY8VFG2_9CORY|nr:D-alanyl-D-alanine carboxypeptidase/D-alanyl-D-alanine-endopeptidase [Corynebacterium breve]WIM67373.1 D-alanyl-D-alanine carboxypeptidase/D-alanyl-D-alanine-endopeptidase [Corynebacterium breve]